MPISDDVSLEAIAAASHGYTGADLEAVCREATMDAIVSNLEGSWGMDENGEFRTAVLSATLHSPACCVVDYAGMNEVLVKQRSSLISCSTSKYPCTVREKLTFMPELVWL